MTTLATETWTGANGAAWPSQWGTLFGAGATACTIQTNAGQMVSGTSAYAWGSAAWLANIAPTDVDVTVDITFGAIVEQYFSIVLRGDTPVNLGAAGTGYECMIYPANGTATLGINGYIGGGQVALSGDLQAGAWVAGTARRVRFRVVGSSIKIKVWAPASAEPTTGGPLNDGWLWTGTDTRVTAPGRVRLNYSQAASTNRTVTLDNLTVTDGATAANFSGTAAFTGAGTLSLPGTGAATDPTMATWASALTNLNTAPAKMFFMGDSLTEGQGASTRALRWQDRVLGTLKTNYGLTSADGYLQAVYGVYDAGDGTGVSNWTQWHTASTGTVNFDTLTGQASTFGLHRVRLSSGATITYTVTGTAVDIWYQQGTGAGSFTYSIDGAAAVPVTVSTTGTLTTVKTSVTGLSQASHTIKITATSSTVYLAGFTVMNADSLTRGIQRYDSGSTSARADHYTSFFPQFMTQVSTVAPDLVTLMLGGNDSSSVTAAVFKSNMSTIISSLKGLAKSPSILLIIPYGATTATTVDPWNSYRQAIIDLAAQYSTGLLDLEGVGLPKSTGVASTYFRADGHPNDTGQAFIGDAIYTKISAQSGTAYAGVPRGIGSVGFTGSGTLGASGAVTSTAPAYSGTAALSGAGTLAPAGTVKTSGNAALTGSGTLGTAVTAKASGSAALAGSGSLSMAIKPSFGPRNVMRASERAGSWVGSPIVNWNLPDPWGGNTAAQITYNIGAQYATHDETYGLADGLVPGRTYAFTYWAKSADGAPLTFNASIEDFADDGSQSSMDGLDNYANWNVGTSWTKVVRLFKVGTTPNVRFLAYNLGGNADGRSMYVAAEGIYDVTSGSLPLTIGFSGSGTLTNTAKPIVPGSLTLTGSGTLGAMTANGGGATVGLTGAGALVGTPVRLTASSTVNLLGSGALTSTRFARTQGVASLTGAGLLSVTGLVATATRLNLSGSGFLDATGVRLIHATMLIGADSPLAMYLGSEFLVAAYYGNARVM